MLQETEELTEEQVRDLIENVYCCKYTGKIKITPLKSFSEKPVGYRISISLASTEYPLEIAFDGTPLECLSRLETILRRDHLHDISFYKGYKITIDPNLARMPNVHFINMNTYKELKHEEVKPYYPMKEIQEKQDWVGTVSEFNNITKFSKDRNYYIYEEIN